LTFLRAVGTKVAAERGHSDRVRPAHGSCATTNVWRAAARTPIMRRQFAAPGPPRRGNFMIIVGIVLLVLGYRLGVSLLWTLGIILVVVGAVLYLLGSVGRPVAGRRHYW
jgi:hypothetical protein